jgi:GIY-YIG catalytic domain-containing protein
MYWRSPCPVPKHAGAYAWYFRQALPGVPTTGCHMFKGLWLLYVGICPNKPPKNGKAPSKRTLVNRLADHLTGNAEGSTLRKTLGCLLSEPLGIHLTRVGSGRRHTFTNVGEQILDSWLDENALVAWVEHSAPWELEAEIIRVVPLPLNIDANEHHPFYTQLRSIRRDAMKCANSRPVVSNNGGPRRLS